MQPQTKLILRTARSLKADLNIDVKQSIGLAIRMIEIVQGHMEDIHQEMMPKQSSIIMPNR